LSSSGGGGLQKSKTREEIEEYKRRIDKLKNLRGKGPSSGSFSGRHGPSNVTSKLSDEEKRRRLAEMEDNAKWRSDVRNKNVTKYKDDERREDEMQERNKGKNMQDEASSLFK
jgi:hypothetical protein